MRFLFLLAFLPFSLIAQNVTITGTAPGAEGKSIQVITFSDLITFHEKVVAKSLIDTTGHFLLSFEIARTIYGSLAIDFHRVDLFIEPGKTYTINVGKIDYNDNKEINPFIQSQNLQIEFQQFDDNELNFLIQQFNVVYNNFLLDNFNALYRDRDKSKLDTLRIQVVRSFLNERNPYFDNYVKYKMASLEQLAQALNQQELGMKYFTNSPILYENVEYMDFFNQYFSKYITVTSKPLKYKDYRSILNGPNSYQGMMKALESDTLLKRPQLRELVMLKGLMEMFNDTAYRKESILFLLNTVAAESKFPDNQLVAKDMVKMLLKLRPGTEAPAFTLKDRNQKDVSLKDFLGKPVLINFWTTYCQGCVGEMDMIKPLFDKYKDKMEFVSISADKEFFKMHYYISLKQNFVWTFLHIGDQIELLKDYDVKVYPLFILVDKEGKIYKYPAENPTSGLGKTIETLLSH